MDPSVQTEAQYFVTGGIEKATSGSGTDIQVSETDRSWRAC